MLLLITRRSRYCSDSDEDFFGVGGCIGASHSDSETIMQPASSPQQGSMQRQHQFHHSTASEPSQSCQCTSHSSSTSQASHGSSASQAGSKELLVPFLTASSHIGQPVFSVVCWLRTYHLHYARTIDRLVRQCMKRFSACPARRLQVLHSAIMRQIHEISLGNYVAEDTIQAVLVVPHQQCFDDLDLWQIVRLDTGQ